MTTTRYTVHETPGHIEITRTEPGHKPEAILSYDYPTPSKFDFKHEMILFDAYAMANSLEHYDEEEPS